MNKYIYQQKNVLSYDVCDKIIQYYVDSKETYEGVTYGGLNKNIKDTRDLMIPFTDPYWENINTVLYESLYANILIYLKQINPDSASYRIFPTNRLSESLFMIQKYQKNKGKYVYHNDSQFEPSKYRVITYIWYLNDVDEGGETEFWGEYRVKPEKGKLVLFPASWTFPHCGKMPISHDKYIVTGWLYISSA
jgi:hypothetical protein